MRLGGLLVISVAVLALPSTGIGASGGSTASALSSEASLSAAEASWSAQGALGQYLDPATGKVVVDVPSSRAGGFALGTTGVAASVRVVQVDGAPVQAALAKLYDLAESPTMSGHSMVFFFYPRDAKIMVRTTLSAASVQAALGSDYDLVEYHSDEVVDLSRCADTSPFWGGAAIDGCNPDNACTTGWDVQNGSGTHYLTTAGHCFAANGIQVFTPQGVLLGSIANRHCSSSVDVEEISGQTYGAHIYVGGATGSSGPVFAPAGDPSVGVTYWWSGSTTYENTTTLTSSSVTYVSPNCGTITNAIAFQNIDKDQCFALGGDSGSPFYIKSGTDVYARGTVNAKDSEFCYGMKWSTISNALGVTITHF